MNTPADEQTSLNYGCITYEKSAAVFDYLMSYMGEDNFDKAMRFYYDKFKFTHADPSDLRKTLSHFNGSELDWFFDHLVNGTDKIDYKMKGISRLPDGSYNLRIKNKTGVAVPFSIEAYKNGMLAGMVWSTGFADKKNVGFPAVDADRFVIDGINSVPEINRSNNYIRAHGIFKKAKMPALNFLTGLEKPDKRQMYFLPAAGLNFYNGAMAGMILHNYGILQKRFEYSICPLYAFKTHDLNGFAEAGYRFYPKDLFSQITIGANAKSFGYDLYQTKYMNEMLGGNYSSLNLRYYAVSPYVELELKKKTPTSSISQYITFSTHAIFREIEDLDTSAYRTYKDEGPKKAIENYYVNSLHYELRNKRVIDPYSASLEIQQNDQMTKASGEFRYGITFSKKHELSFRFFAGTFINSKGPANIRYAFRMSGYNGYQDYLFNDNFVARNETNGLGFSQMAEYDGAMKVWTPLGQTTEWLVALNVKSPRLFILPVRLYADIASADGRSMLNEKVLWCGGVNVTLWDDIVEVYIPAAYSQDIRSILDLNQVDMWNRIRFTLNLHKLVPRKMIRQNLL